MGEREPLDQRAEGVLLTLERVMKIVMRIHSLLIGSASTPWQAPAYTMSSDYIHGYENITFPHSYFIEVLTPVLQGLPTNAAILDIGAGTAALEQLLREKGYVNTTSVDFTAIGLSSARLDNPFITATQADAYYLPFASKSMQVIHCKDMLVHIREKAEFFQEVQRVLKPGGIFVCTTTAGSIVPEKGYALTLPMHTKRLMKKLGFGSTQLQFWSPTQAEANQDWFVMRNPKDRPIQRAVLIGRAPHSD